MCLFVCLLAFFWCCCLLSDVCEQGKISSIIFLFPLLQPKPSLEDIHKVISQIHTYTANIFGVQSTHWPEFGQPIVSARMRWQNILGKNTHWQGSNNILGHPIPGRLTFCRLFANKQKFKIFSGYVTHAAGVTGRVIMWCDYVRKGRADESGQL